MHELLSKVSPLKVTAAVAMLTLSCSACTHAIQHERGENVITTVDRANHAVTTYDTPSGQTDKGGFAQHCEDTTLVLNFGASGVLRTINEQRAFAESPTAPKGYTAPCADGQLTEADIPSLDALNIANGNTQYAVAR